MNTPKKKPCALVCASAKTKQIQKGGGHNRADRGLSFWSLALTTLMSMLASSALACGTTNYITKTAEIADSTITGNGGAVSFTPSYTGSGASSSCDAYAELHYWHDANNAWQSYTELSFVTSFATSASTYWDGGAWDYYNNAGATTIQVSDTASAYKPFTEYGFRMRIYSPNSGDEEYWFFNTTIYHQCYSNLLTVQTNPSDVAYLIEADGTTPSNTEIGRVTGSISEANCPLTRVAEIWDDEAGEFVALSTSWSSVVDNGSSSNQMEITIQTEDYATLDNTSIDESVYYLRVHTYDPDSYAATTETSQTFTVTFNYECESSIWTISPTMSQQDIAIESGSNTISYGATQTYSQCDYTITREVFNNATSEWENINTFGWYSSATDTTIVANIASADYASYRPEVFYAVRITWVSTYSEDVDGTVVEEFNIRFYDTCFSNYFTATSELLDYTYNVDSGSYKFQPSASYSTSIATGTCPLTATCEIFTDSQREWEDCNTLPYSNFYSSFNTAGGDYTVIYSSTDFMAHYSAPYDDVPYLVRITMTDPRSVRSDATYQDEFQLTLSYACALDVIALTSTNIAGTQVVLDSGSAVNRQITYTQSVSGCPLTFGLEFYDEDEEIWDTYTTESFVSSFSTSTGALVLLTGDEATYDMLPWFNVTAKLTVISDHSVMTTNEVEDTFLVTIVEKCRMVAIDTTMSLGSGGAGARDNPYTIDMWQRLDIPMTSTTYKAAWADPDTYQNCEVTHTLHYSNGDRTTVDLSSQQTYLFDDGGTKTATQLSLQWNEGVFDDYFVVVIEVVYTRTNEVVMRDEGFVYVKVSNPCLLGNGGAITAQSISDIDYWIKDATDTTTLTVFDDAPTTRDGLQTYLYTNGDNLCGPKTYEIVMADQTTSNTNTAYLTLRETATNLYIDVVTSDPVYYTNADVTYYIKVTLDDYVDDYGDDEATYFEIFLLNMLNCQIQTFNKDADSAEEYILYTPTEKYPYTAWTDNPEAGTARSPAVVCGYDVIYSVQWRTFYDTVLDITLPDMIYWQYDPATSSGTHSFWVQSDDIIDPNTERQTYTIELTGTIQTSDMNPAFSETQVIELTVVNTCPTDTITKQDDTFTDYIYYINENTEESVYSYLPATPQVHTTFNANWYTTIPYCPIDFEIVRDYNGDGTYAALTAWESSVVSLINPMVITIRWDTWQEQFALAPTTFANQYYNDPQITLQITTADYTYDGEEWLLAVNRVSSRSDVDNDSSRVTFTLTLRDVCWDLPLDAAEGSATLTHFLWDVWTLTFNTASIDVADNSWPSTSTYCGSGFEYNLLYISNVVGEVPDDSVTDMDVKFLPVNDLTFDSILLTTKDWVGTHEVQIKSTIGQTATTLYTTNFIAADATIQLEIVNPCLTTTYTIPDAKLGQEGSDNLSTVTFTKGAGGGNVLQARELGGQVIFQYEAPSDSASVTYGPNVAITDTMGLCGTRRHYIIVDDDERIYGTQDTTQKMVAAPYLEFEYFPSGDPYDRFNSDWPPVYQIRVNATSMDDWGSHNLKLYFELDEYAGVAVSNGGTGSDANLEYWELNIQIEYCLVESWTPPADFPTYFTVGMKPITIEYIYQQFPCSYGATYSGKLMEISGEEQSDQTVPDIIQIDSRSGALAVYSNDLDDLGWYVIEITATLDVIDNLGTLDDPSSDPDFFNEFLYDSAGNKVYAAEFPPPDFVYESSFNITIGVIEVNETSVLDKNSAPYLLPPPPREIKAVIGEELVVDFGNAYDFEGDNVTIYFEARLAWEFIEFDYEALTLFIEEGATSAATQPVFDLKLTLQDDNELGQLSKVYDFKLVMVKDPRQNVLQAIAEAEVTEVLRAYEGRVYDLTEASIDEVTSIDSRPEDISVPDYNPQPGSIEDILSGDSRDQEEDEEVAPVPYFVSLTNDGIVTLRFSTPMKVPDLKELSSAKVALRKLNSGDVTTEIYKTQSGLDEFQIRDAFEIRIEPSSVTEDPIKLDYTWELVNFSTTEVQIKLIFEIPEAVSASSTDPDSVVVTFWADDLFKAENGQSIPRGLTISAPINRQVSAERFDSYKEKGQIAGYVSLSLLIICFFWALNVNADTLPIWACYDCLVLISHLPLVNVALGGGPTIFLSTVARILRFEFIPLDDLLTDQFTVGSAENSFNAIFQQNGYKSTAFLLNLASFTAFFIIMILVNAFSKCMDCSYAVNRSKPMVNGRTHVPVMTASQKALNASFRLILLTFFENFICILLNFKAEIDKNNDFQKISGIVALFFLIISALFIGLLFLMMVVDSDPEIEQNQPPQAALTTVYLNMSNYKKNAANLFMIVYALRRAIYATVFVLMDKYPALQLHTLMVAATIQCMILLRGMPYTETFSRVMLVSFEAVFLVACAFTMVFSGEYSHRSYKILDDVGMGLCLTIAVTLVGGIGCTLYSISWQINFNHNRRNNMLRNEEKARLLASKRRLKAPKVMDPIEEEEEVPDDESSDVSYVNVRAKQRMKQKQRKLNDMVQHTVNNIEIDMEKAEKNNNYDDELNELEKLAGIGQPVDGQEGHEGEDYVDEGDNDSVGRSSVGAESSYSEFMQQWKSKLYADGDIENDKNGPSDVVSNYSRRSGNNGDDSPFKGITPQQTRTLLKGDSTKQAIPEVYEDSQESDDIDGVILTKTERRRLNQISSRVSLHSNRVTVAPEAPAASAFDGSKVTPATYLPEIANNKQVDSAAIDKLRDTESQFELL